MNKFYFTDSTILAKFESLSLTEMTNATSSQLIYRASRDGFSYQNFHSKCDKKANVVAIIKNNLNFVFGGYSAVGWTSEDGLATDTNAFIFSLRNDFQTKTQTFKVKKSEHAIYNGSRLLGLVFGFGGCNIDICNNSNVNTGSYTNFGTDYEIPESLAPESLSSRLTEPHQIEVGALSGNFKNWLTTEIEVYQIDN